MERNRMIFLSVIVVSTALCFISIALCFIFKEKYKAEIKKSELGIELEIEKAELQAELEASLTSFKNPIKSKELEIGLYDQYTYCIKTIMKESKNNGNSATLSQAEKACTKFNKNEA